MLERSSTSCVFLPKYGANYSACHGIIGLLVLLTGVEDVVNESGSEENISVVTFGGQADVAQHLTNDFSRVRDAIGESLT